MRALAAIGWSSTDLARIYSEGGRRGGSEYAIRRLRKGVSPVVRQEIAERIAAIYDQLSGTPGPTPRARTWARRPAVPWSPPLLWEGVDIDDPRARPVAGLIPQKLPARRQIDPDELLFLLSGGETPESLTERFGFADVKSVHRLIMRARRGETSSGIPKEQRRTAKGRSSQEESVA